MRTKYLATAALMSAALVMTSPASADAWNWGATGAGISGSGQFTTAGSAVAPELITSWGGTWDGQSILGLASPNPPGFLADNLFVNAPAYFNNNGVVFNVGGSIGVVNLYASLTQPQLYEFSYSNIPAGSSNGWGNGTPGPGGGYGIPIQFTVAAVPEPETYAMMLAGLGLMGFIARRRKQG
jgi:hypothetical protein